MSHHHEHENDPNVTVQFSTFGGVLTKLHILHPVGYMVPQHVHEYDHQTLVVNGGLGVWQNGVFAGNYFQGAILNIPRKVAHTFQALTANSAFACIHNMDLWEETDPASPGLYKHADVMRGDGVTFGVETFGPEIVAEAEQLIGDNMEAIGEERNALRVGNVALLQTLQEQGVFRLVIARGDGRMLGYAMSFISPTLYAAEAVEGICSSFYSVPYPGLALRLQRAAVDDLRACGCASVSVKVGTKGLRPRAATIARRLGAKPTATFWTLEFDKGPGTGKEPGK